MNYQTSLIFKLKTDANKLMLDAESLRKQADVLEEEAHNLLEQAKCFENEDKKIFGVIAKDILKASNERLGGFALETMYDAIDERSLDEEQLHRFRLLAREYLYTVV